jgi:hypothetical protein
METGCLDTKQCSQTPHPPHCTTKCHHAPIQHSTAAAAAESTAASVGMLTPLQGPELSSVPHKSGGHAHQVRNARGTRHPSEIRKIGTQKNLHIRMKNSRPACTQAQDSPGCVW